MTIMNNWKQRCQDRALSLEQAVQKIESGDVVYVGNTTGTPYKALDMLAKRYRELENVTIVTNVCLQPFEMLMNEKYKTAFRVVTLFLDTVERIGLKTGITDVSSTCYSYVERALRESLKVNSILVEMTEPDKDGYCNFGVSSGWMDTMLDYVDTDKIIVVMNKEQFPIPGTRNFYHVNEIGWFCRHDHVLPEFTQPEVKDIDHRIAAHILEQIQDGDTIQIGRGGLANAIGYGLTDRKGLSVHTEILTDSVVELAKAGNVVKIYTSSGFGGKLVYDYCREGHVSFGTTYEMMNPDSIGKVDHFVSINSCLMADLTGQICSEAVGPRQHSCIGGQLDFVRGAAKARNGRSFLCLRSTYQDKAGKVHSNILTHLPLGSVVTTPRADVMYVVTEYGIADLYLKTIKERVRAMISIAHPDFRFQLMEEAATSGVVTMSDLEGIPTGMAAAGARG